ncbi:hydrogenase maturation protease [Paraburkholderia acidisoli]|uniref:Hydrogenase maturation protease n=1 Tax=Paraburkholderia acidisoli TaxID=2571748 RepID=A0A7Z2JF55_9BURK|nr:hydrogenase maturation protease [Paraburkholderia acidisoli]QGZ61134.1 hydrogenase maturation protease [Paraburkholderia acidisoli]
MVLGLGNAQWGDAGAGMRALARLQARWRFPQQVEFVEGGTRGRALVPLLQATQRMLVLSAVEMGDPPGTLRVFTGDAAAERLYVHLPKRPGMGFADALACAQLSGQVPRDLVLIGIQPQRNDHFGARLSVAVEGRLDQAVDTARHWLQRWRIEPLAPVPAGAARTGSTGSPA